MALTPRTYDMLAGCCREIDALLAQQVPMSASMHAKAMEIIIGRLAWHCAQRNPAFDSARFVRAATGSRDELAEALR